MWISRLARAGLPGGQVSRQRAHALLRGAWCVLSAALILVAGGLAALFWWWFLDAPALRLWLAVAAARGPVVLGLNLVAVAVVWCAGAALTGCLLWGLATLGGRPAGARDG